MTAPAATVPPTAKHPGPYLSYCWGGTAERVNVAFAGKAATTSYNGLEELRDQPGRGCTWPVPADSVIVRYVEVENATTSGWVACSFKDDGRESGTEVNYFKAVCGAGNI